MRMIEEDDMNKRLLGQVATVEQALPGNHVMLKFDNALELGVLAGRAMPTELLELAGECKAAPELRSFARVPTWVKRFLLRQGGVQDSEVEILTPLKVGDQAAEDHLDLFVALVEWSFGLEEQTKVKVVPVSLASRLLSDARGEKYNFDQDVPPVEIINR